MPKLEHFAVLLLPVFAFLLRACARGATIPADSPFHSSQRRSLSATLDIPGKKKKKLKPSLHLCEPAVRTHKAPLPSPQLPPQTPMVCLTRASCWFCESSARRSKMVAPLSIGERRQPSSMSCKQKFDQMKMEKNKTGVKNGFWVCRIESVFFCFVVFLFFYRTVRIGIFF